MIAKNWTRWTTLLLISTLTISGCSLIPNKKVEIVSKPLEIDIIQPTMPRNIDLKEPKFYVVSEARIANPCIKNEEGKRDCSLGKENPDWPEGYTYLDRFLDDMKEQNNGEVVFVATTIGDYKVMAEDMQELKRYIKQLGEVVIYYRDVTMPNGEKGVGVAIEKKD
mgnify:CR=1 FL=1